MPPIWSVGVRPMRTLTFATVFTLLGELGVLLYAWLYEPGPLRSVSAVIGRSSGLSIVYATLVYVHGYSLLSYLVLASGYLSTSSAHFRLMATMCALYWGSLIVVSYIPISLNDEHHNAAAFMAFFFACCTTVLHRHSFWHAPPETALMVVEVAIMVGIVGLGALFWFAGAVLAEYGFIALILLDKYVKIRTLHAGGLVDVDNRLEYRFVRARDGYGAA